jgi:hypothetical protein
MDGAEAYKRTIEGIKNRMECPRAFACLEPGSEKPALTRLVAGGKLVECLEHTSTPCQFAVDFGIGRFCECPLRAFLLQNPSG